MKPVECPECKAVTEYFDGAIHEYMISSPGCWKTFGEILSKEYSDPNYMSVHRLTVDAYACQHVGGDDARAKQSVIVHLIALCLAIEFKMDFAKIPPIMDEIIKDNKGRFPKLTRPDFTKTLNVTNVFQAKTAAEHCELVTQWAKSVWDAWGAEHLRIRQIVELSKNKKDISYA